MTILTVTLNAAIDKRYDVPEVSVGRVQRVEKVVATAGGKGLNVTRGALLSGHAVIATGFVGGFAGAFVTSEVAAMGAREEFVRVAGETRTCINIIDAAGASTEFLEPGVTIGPDDLAELRSRFGALLTDADVVTLSGSAPPGCPADVYVPLIEAAKAAGRPVILDTSGDLLAAGILARPTVVKPNRDELAALVGTPVGDPVSVVAAARELCRRGVGWVVVSLGSDGAIAVSPERAVLVRAQPVPAVNPVGCGDVLVAGLAGAIADGLDVPDALHQAVRIATAAAAHPGTGSFDPAYARTLSLTTHDL